MLKQQLVANGDQKDHNTLNFQEVQHMVTALSKFVQKAVKAQQTAAQHRQANLDNAGAVGQGNQAKSINLQALPDDQRRLILQQQQQRNHELQQQQAREQHLKQQQQHRHFLAQQEFQRMQKQHEEQLARQQQQKSQEQKQQQQREQEQPQSKQHDQQQRPPQKAQTKQTAKQRQAQQQREKNSKPPSAPVDPKPPFALSPHRVPQYADSHATPKKLELPPSKKSKISQPAGKTSTSAAAAATAPTEPATIASPLSSGKTASPAARRALVQDAKIAPDVKPQFRCTTAECESRIFQNQAELDRHTNDAHAKIEDPFGFVMGCMAKALGLNEDGSLKAVVADISDTKHQVKSKAQSGAAAALASHSPSIKQEASTPVVGGTPMARITTQSGLRSSPAMMHLKTPQHGSRPLTPRSTPGKGSAALAQKTTAETTLPTPAPESSLDEASVPSPWANSALQPETLVRCFEGLDYLWGASILSPPKELASPALTPTSKTSETSKSGTTQEKAGGEAGMAFQSVEAKKGKDEHHVVANNTSAITSTAVIDYDSAFFDLDAAGAPITVTDADALDDLCSLGLFAEDDIFDFRTSNGNVLASASTSASAGNASNVVEDAHGTAGSGACDVGGDVAADKERVQKLLSMEWDQVIGANAGLEVDLPGFDVTGLDMWASL